MTTRGKEGRAGARLAGALFGLALLAFPRRRRGSMGREAAEAFADGFERRKREEGSAVAWRFAIRAVIDAVGAGVEARWVKEQRQPGGSGRRTGRGGGRGEMRSELSMDVRHAARRLGKAPGFTLSVVVILALGVGVNAAVFSALEDAVLAKPPFPDADRLVFPRFTLQAPGKEESYASWSFPRLRELRHGAAPMLRDVVGYAVRFSTWSEPGDAESVPLEYVTSGYFDLLCGPPAAGRFFRLEEEGLDAAPDVAVIAWDVWKTRFGGAAGAVGATVVLDGSRVRIVGVAPEGFRGMSGRADLWLPVGQASPAMGSWTLTMRNALWLDAVAKLATGVTVPAATAALARVGATIEAVEPMAQPDQRVGLALTPVTEAWTNPTARRSLVIVAVAALFVLINAVVNLTALVYARGRRESRELALRLALGSGKARLLRARAVESLLLAGVGAAAGLTLAYWAVAGLRVLWPSRLLMGAAGGVQSMTLEHLRLDPKATALGVGVAVIAALLFGVLPTLAQSSLDPGTTLKSGSGTRGTVRPGGRGWARPVLLAAQLAMSVVLLVGSGLLASTLYHLHQVQGGFDHTHLVTLDYSLVGRPVMASQASLRDFHDALRTRIGALPGVEEVASGTTPPLTGHFSWGEVTRVGPRAPFPEGARPRVGVHFAGDGFFRTLGIGLLRGRTFSSEEARAPSHVVVLSRVAATELFPDGDAVGRSLRLRLTFGDSIPEYTVVGIVNDVLYGSPTEGTVAEAYFPDGIWARPTGTLYVRTTGAPGSVVPLARAALRELDSRVPFWRVRTGDRLSSEGEGLSDARLLLVLLAIFAGLAVVLSAAGVWAVVAHAVSERRSEIGLRMALGARSRQVERLMLRQGALPLLIGGVLGLALSALGAHLLVGVLFRTDALDPRVYAGAAAGLSAVGLLASWLPARRAARVAPMEVLSCE
jgi:putative ABC transport system permease protein